MSTHRWFPFLLAISIALGCAPLHAQTPTRTPTPTPLALTPTPSSLYFPMTPGGSDSTLYLPVIVGSVQAQPTRSVQPVYGLAGSLRADGDVLLLRLSTDAQFTLLAAAPEIDRELAALAARRPAPEVKVWGTLYGARSGGAGAFIVVSAILDSSAPPTATPPAAPTAIGRFESVNLRSAPDAQASRTGVIRQGQRCMVVGRDAQSAWALLQCPAGVRGWVEPRLVTLVGGLESAPVVSADVVAPPTSTPTPTPSPTPPPFTFTGWRTLFYDNATLSGVPVAVDDLTAIAFDWGSGPLRPGLPADLVSISFERSIAFDPGFYFFTVEADDGVRVLIDGVLALDQWSGAAGRSYRFGRLLAGAHDLRVEYNESLGAARLRLAWERATESHWQATYAGLPNAPGGALAQSEPDGGQYRLDYSWGSGSPGGAPAEGWTARWSGRYFFETGTYLFGAAAEDGVRVAIDGALVLDKWTEGYGEVRNRFLGVGAGDHLITVDYYDHQGNASIRVWWFRETPAGGFPQ